MHHRAKLLLIMLTIFVKVQFFKYASCIVLYFICCLILIKVLKRFDLKEATGVKIRHKQPLTSRFLVNSESRIKKGIEFELGMLRMDELRGEAIDLQKSATLLRQVSDICTKYNLKTPLVKRHFLYNNKHKSLYCWIRKAASTSFTKLFSDMNNRQITHDFYKEVDFLSPESVKQLQNLTRSNTVFKLLVVRHPFQRLVSSYRDRIEDNSKYTAQSWLYARQIFYLSRPELFRSNMSSVNSLQRIFFPDRRLKVVPTFREFVEWLLKQSPRHDDVHWAQYHTHCAVCNVSYNFILKLDEYTLGETNYVLSKLKLDRNKVYLPRLQRTHAGASNFDVTCRYLSNVTTDMISRLYERYKMDFEMYNYKPDRYMHCAKGKN